MRRIRWAGAAGVCLLAALGASADEGGVSVQSGETLFSQGTSLCLTYLHSRGSRLCGGSHQIPNDEDRVREENWAILGVSYGIRQDLTVSLVVPYVQQRETSDTDGGGDAGLGDVSVVGKGSSGNRVVFRDQAWTELPHLSLFRDQMEGNPCPRRYCIKGSG